MYREFPNYIKQHFDPKKHKKIAMYCTGGIRCEKSTSYMKNQGFEEVYHLEGGILKYLEEVPKDKTLWQGECYVFDERVTVVHELKKGTYEQCNACRLPITQNDMLSQYYQQGISCPHCYNKTTPKQKARFTEREKQITLAKQRGTTHLGNDTTLTVAAVHTEKNPRSKTTLIK
jgi:UPF0176 protein